MWFHFSKSFVMKHHQIHFSLKKMDRKCNAFSFISPWVCLWQTQAFFNPVKREVIYFVFIKGCSHNDTWESKRQICVSSCSPVQPRLSYSVQFDFIYVVVIRTVLKPLYKKCMFSIKHFVNCSEKSVRVISIWQYTDIRSYSDSDMMNKLDYELWSLWQ